MTNRWESRIEPRTGEGKLCWHILLRDNHQLMELVAAAQDKLRAFPGLHFTPHQWLHLTTLVMGSSENFTNFEIDRMVALTREALTRLRPITITLGSVIYDPEAIALGIRPYGMLTPVLNALRMAAGQAIGREVAADPSWIPHVTVAFSTSVQPAGPIIAALGHDLPGCEATISSINLIVQEGPERSWHWRSIAKVPLGT